MYDNVPIVPNLYSAPENPNTTDCYYNITLDKYYIYDGTQWLEAKNINDPSVIDYNAILIPRTGGSLENVAVLEFKTKIFELQYSIDNGQTFTTIKCSNYEDLVNKANSLEMRGATDITITVEDNNFSVVGKIYPKVIFNKNLVENININGTEIDQSIFDEVLVFYKVQPLLHWQLTYIDANDNIQTTIYNNYDDLKTFIETTNLELKAISIVEGSE